MKKCLLLFAAAAISSSVYAQDNARFITTADSLHIYEVMRENAPQNPNIKDVSRFTLVGKDSKFYLGMGANVKMVGDFDWGDPISNPNIFAPKDLKAPAEPGDRGQTLFSVGQSNIYWNFVALPGSKNQVGLFFDVIFLGQTSKPVIEIHHLYMKYRGFTAGYVVSTFTDLKAEPKSIDFGGPNAMCLVRHPNIYYTARFGKDKMWSAQLGLDMPDMASFNNWGQTKKVNQRMPDIPLFLQRSWAGGNGWLRASAIFRDLQYRDLVAKRNLGENKGVFGWGVKLSGKTPIGGGLSANYMAVYGKGISSYIQDLSGEEEDLILAKGSQEKLQAVPVWGAYGSLEYAFGKCGFINFTYSQVRAYANHTGAAGIGEMYKYGQYVTSNLIFNVSSFAQVGVEYLWGRRMNYNGTQNHDNRVMLMLNVSI